MHYRQQPIHFSLYTIHLTPYTVHISLHTLHFTPYSVHGTLYTVPHTLQTVHPTQYTINCTHYNIHSTQFPYNIQYKFYTINFIFLLSLFCFFAPFTVFNTNMNVVLVLRLSLYAAIGLMGLSELMIIQ
jgi:hypothetical protein